MILFIITYLAGVLTILSPCILPVLPFVFSKSEKSFLKSGLPLLLGMGLTFSLFSALAIIGGEWIGQANEFGRIFALVLFSVLGLSLIFPTVSEKLMGPLARLGSKIGVQSKSDSLSSSVLIGISTGLLWAPCAGPILGLVLTGAATQGQVGKSILLLTSYSLGAMTSLSLALVAGNKFLGSLKKFLKVDQLIKKILGFTVLLGVATIAFNLDRTVLTQLSKLETVSIEKKLLSLTKSESNPELPITTLPELSGATAWLNTSALSPKELSGKVVLIDFWTYSCINCLRTLPYVKTWAEKYKEEGLVVIGVHAPEFAFEKIQANVESAMRDSKINYPVAIDNEFRIWNAFHNQYWPAHYFFDRQGKLRHYHFGEGDYIESEKVIRDLLSENGQVLLVKSLSVQAEGVQAPSSEMPETSPESYIGFTRAENFASLPSIQNDKIANYQLPKKFEINQWALQGLWIINRENAVLQKDSGKILHRFKGRDLHLVLGGSEKIKFKVKLDGKAPGPNKGVDISEDGLGVIDSHRLYQLIRLQESESIKDHLFEIEFFDSGAEAYAFTFG